MQRRDIIVDTWTYLPYTLVGPPVWRPVLDPIAAYTSTTVYLWTRDNDNVYIFEEARFVNVLPDWVPMEKVGKTMLNFSSSSAMVSGNSSLAENLLLFLYFSVKILTCKYT